MILIVGGQGAGKREFVRSLGYAEDDIDARLDGRGAVLVDLHLALKNVSDVSDSLFEDLLRREVVVCNEVGAGIVPMDAAERAWRDRVGRTCARLAGRADRVVRLCCGIPLDIKGGGRCG